MQDRKQWRATSNLELLLNDVHPPARIERGFWPEPSTKALTGHTPQVSTHRTTLRALVDARSVVNFNKATYCGTQEMSSPMVRRTLVKYYQDLLRRICIRSSSFLDATKLGNDLGARDLRREQPSEHSEGEADAQPSSATLEHGQAPGSLGSRRYRAVGILTHVHDVVGAQALQPWEFFVIHDLDDETAYLPALQALQKETAPGPFAALFARTTGLEAVAAADTAQLPESGDVGAKAGSRAELHWADSAEPANPALEGQRLSLFPRLLGPFTGVYRGMAVGIVGEPHQRSARGVLTAVLLFDLVFPHRPVLPWRVDRPLPSVAAAVPTRVQFCCGPFPRAHVAALLRAATLQALLRSADVLIVGGPLIPCSVDLAGDATTPQLFGTFDDRLSSYVDVIETCLNEYYASRAPLPRLRVVVVPHREDVIGVPVLPRVNYPLEDTPDIHFRSNPCRLSVNGVHFSVCNEDIVGVMRRGMVERWPTPEGSLRRVVETLVQSRWYTPILELPAAQVDMKYFHKMRIDYVPQEVDLFYPKSPSSYEVIPFERIEQNNIRSPHAQNDYNWNKLFLSTSENEDRRGRGVSEPHATKRARTEKGVNKSENSSCDPELDSRTPPSPPSSLLNREVVEYMPHVIFAPSTRPQFAIVTHQGVYDSDCCLIRDESVLDDTMAASGLLVVNQCVWSERTSKQYTLRIAEVTIPDSALVVARGASVATGVSCGILHIFDPEGS